MSSLKHNYKEDNILADQETSKWPNGNPRQNFLYGACYKDH